jgi:hypothetical protein
MRSTDDPLGAELEAGMRWRGRFVRPACGYIENSQEKTTANALYFAARFLAAFGDQRALDELGCALDGGFMIDRVLLRRDAWLDPLRSTSEFHAPVERSRIAYRHWLDAYVDAGGERLLGRVPSPEELDPAVTW